ncbi:MAG: TerB family tellurite resistance protein [Candidatus Poseidoniales archaeon]|nr:MAG: TerB family tellurite resistance protein [Candidatus Poseidoniales archaeon]
MIHRSSQERMRYAQVLVYIAAADGALVREEIAMIEAMMGKAMMHPESRITVRAGFEQPIPLEQSLADLDPEFAQVMLRDAALVAAVDGDYDRKELTALRKIAKVGKVSPNQLSDLLDWVSEGWNWFEKGVEILVKK